MNMQHVNIKIPVEGELPVKLEKFIPVFHRWIRENALGEMMIDVADYGHVPNGPGVMLLGHEADYSLDHNGGVYGLLYNRKAELVGSNAERYLAAFGCAAKACGLLEAEFPSLKFSRTRFELIVNDRALAPNTPETLAAFQPEFEAYLKETFGDGFTVENTGEPRQRFGVTVTLESPMDFARFDAN